ncbi:hypothetical protein HBI56_221900 [Parastagonospora nodorum]|nr:hypothetical protein HBI09_215680 [Parastagonospora nodorum]KAH4216917.1 hypothetical protein HBI06_222330 [Parastagonospora nodorum]KAH4226154.1 hypothetical protein HBI05_224000 [Parastagonospora nodorum]KAH4335520.1 hypothetical protein HBH98_234850 [Parastagonospora nodorum]KAH4358193.1 hypothetical protein HBH97_218960 [Parastagonospora nodorum]
MSEIGDAAFLHSQHDNFSPESVLPSTEQTPHDTHISALEAQANRLFDTDYSISGCAAGL